MPTRSMTIRAFVHTIGVVLTIGGCTAAGIHVGMSSGRGVVLDTESEEPIAGATVSLRCLRARYHGTSHVKDIAATTDAAGRYTFSTAEVRECHFADVRAAQQGYVELHPRLDSFTEIPPRLFLTPGCRGGHAPAS
jgi:hypothetical protein